MERVYLSRDGLEKLRNDLEHLVKTVRPEATADLARAREHGDLSENAEYDAAREKLGDIDRRISEMQRHLSQVELVEDDTPAEEARILCSVTLKDIKTNKEIEYTLVDPTQSDPMKRRISVKSPIGKALLGKKVSEKVEVEVPSGKLEFLVVSIERAQGL